uniref:Ig-like domain-containing protein n=1 Tax=Laticauda laticaudata TaxID=8630 RepID=A0A8C5SNT7_LATLA
MRVFQICFSQVVLTQSDPVLKKPGESQKLTCAVTGFNVNGYWMGWVRQKPGQGLEWLLPYYDESNRKYYAPTIQGRFSSSKDSSNFFLQMNNLKADDTAVYYCARYTVKGVLGDLMQKLLLRLTETKRDYSPILTMVEQLF